MTRLNIRMFGQISLQRDDQPLRGLSAKALELLCYLLLNRGRGHTRESLACTLWPETPETVSKKYLRQAIWQLHSAVVGPVPRGEQESSPLLALRPGWVRINPQAGWWLDVAAFEQAYDLCRDTRGTDLTDAQAQALEAAVVLYRGDLIETWYQDWCLYERDRLQQTYLAMLEQMMGHCEARGRFATGIAYGQSILRYDPAREPAHRNLMRLYYQAGDRTTALRQYERCASALAKHFSLRPSQETEVLCQQIRTEHLAPPSGAACSAGSGSDLLVGLHGRLDRIQASLAVLHQQVQQEMALISQLTGRDVRDIAAADSR